MDPLTLTLLFALQIGMFVGFLCGGMLLQTVVERLIALVRKIVRERRDRRGK